MSLIPSHTIAQIILDVIDRFLDWVGLGRYQTIEEIIYFAIILSASFVIGWALRRLILYIVRKFVQVKNTDFGKQLLQMKTLSKCSHIIPPLVFMGLVPFAFESSAAIHHVIIIAALVYMFIMFGIALSAILSFVYERYDQKENTKNLPLKGILNVSVGLVWGVVIILSISVIVQKSPAALLGGLTAFAAVLMLIFKDTILGFVAGIQMSQNDMVRVGDWITVPSTPADGIVMDVSLSTVKVCNFDNTIVMVPPYRLVSEAFKNWRGMSDSGVRRIAMNVYVNPDTIKAPDDTMLSSITEKYPQMKGFIDTLQAKETKIQWQAGTAPVNGTLETNLGLYRAYTIMWLRGSEMIDHTKDLMVSMSETTAEGVAMQVYCFAVTTQWEQYEAVKSAVMEHALLTASDFGLEVLSADHLNISSEK